MQVGGLWDTHPQTRQRWGHNRHTGECTARYGRHHFRIPIHPRRRMVGAQGPWSCGFNRREDLDASGVYTAVNLWGADGLHGRVVDPAQGTVVYYLGDVQGTIAQQVDASRQVVATAAYDAWGRPLTAGTAPYGYKGQWGYYTDADTGYILCTYRYYVPAAGRWLTRDPIGYAGGINLYAYCANDPVNRVDPNGLCPDGHHWVPQSLWDGSDKLDISADAIKVFDNAKTGKLIEHNFKRPHGDYNRPYRK